jgi:hypothetical protein
MSSGQPLHFVYGTGGDFRNFAPYVPAVNRERSISFQADVDGGSGVYTIHQGDVETIAEASPHFTAIPPDMTGVISHPARNTEGWLCAYAQLANEQTGLLAWKGTEVVTIASSGKTWRGIGPLGPTMNEEGRIGFRGMSHDGHEGVWLGHVSGEVHCIAKTGDTFVGFQGLPVVNDSNQVLYRADLHDGHEAIYCWQDGESTCIVSTTEGEWTSLGRFPTMNAKGQVAFVGTRQDGTSAVGLVEDGVCRLAVHPETCESIRGVLLSGAGESLVFATPTGGRLGIYRGDITKENCVLAIGEEHFGGVVADFALNPVSMNEQGDWAVRVGLEDGRQLLAACWEGV